MRLEFLSGRRVLPGPPKRGLFCCVPPADLYIHMDTRAHTGAREGGPRFGAAAMQGWRVRMEDAHVANLALGDPAQRLSLFGVFDGHVRARMRRSRGLAG